MAYKKVAYDRADDDLKRLKKLADEMDNLSTVVYMDSLAAPLNRVIRMRRNGMMTLVFRRWSLLKNVLRRAEIIE